jgi:hypothetical protein
MVLFLYYTMFGFELINQKTFETQLTHLTFFIFYLKMIVCQNFSLPHTYGHCQKKPIFDMIIIKLFTWFTNLFQSYGTTMFDRYHKFYQD